MELQNRRYGLKNDEINEIRPDEIDYELPSGNAFLSSNANMVPGNNTTQLARTFYGSRFFGQTLPAVNREAPLVQALIDNDPDNKSFEEYYGTSSGALRSPYSGTVLDVQDNRITVKDEEGNNRDIDLYKNFSFNRKTQISQTPKVKKGDKISKNDLIATSNYTNDDGTLALGLNARVALVPFRGHSLDDATVVTQSFANRMTSDHMYSYDKEFSRGVKSGKNHFVSLFPEQFTKDQLEKLDSDGVVKPGTVVHPDDPLVLATSPKVVSSQDAQLGKLSRSMKHSRNNSAQVWDHAHPGVVTDVSFKKGVARVNVSTQEPLQHGDKIVFRDGQKSYHPDTEVFTERGWVKIDQILKTDKLAALFDKNTNNENKEQDFEARFVAPYDAHSYIYAGELYGLETNYVGYLTTPNHRIWRKGHTKGCSKWYALDASEVHGKAHSFMIRSPFNLDERKDPETIDLGESYNDKSNEPLDHKHVFEFSYFVKFLALYLSEGNVRTNCASSKFDYTVIITQKEREFCREIENVLDGLGLSWKKYNDQYCTQPNKPLSNYLKHFGKSYQKFIPSFIKNSSLETVSDFLKFYYQGDENKEKESILYTSSKRMAEDLGYLLTISGFACSINERPEREHNNYPGYVVRKITYETVGTRKNYQKDYYKEHYNGPVYCVQVPGAGVILTRFRGRVMWNGNSTIAKIIPDELAPRTEDGEPIEVLQNSLGLPSRVNPNLIYELLLGEVARKRGEPIKVPLFNPKGTKWYDVVEKLLEKEGIPKAQLLYDPELNQYLENPVAVGTGYMHKLHHTSASKASTRGIGGYSMDQQPVKGGGSGAKAKRLSGLEGFGLLGAGATGVLKDMALLRGQENNENYWRMVRQGFDPATPGTPFVWDKFKALLSGSGFHAKDLGEGRIQLGAYTDKELMKNHPIEIQKGKIVDTKDMKPVKGGLFDDRITGRNSWGYIPLPFPVPNPAFEKPVKRLLDLTDSSFKKVMQGNQMLGDETGPEAIHNALKKLDLEAMEADAMDIIKSGKKTKRPHAIQKLNYIAGIRKQGLKPSELMIRNVPVIPPNFRPFSIMGDTFVSGDANELYKDIFDIRDSYKKVNEALGDEGSREMTTDIYDAVKAVYGYGSPVGAKTSERGREVSGFLKQLTGKGSPKFSFMQRKMLSKPVDFSGRGVISVDPELGLDELGVPEDMLWDLYKTHIQKALVRRGTRGAKALEAIKERTPEARKVLERLITPGSDGMPVMYSRAPAWHKHNTLGAWPKMVEGDNIYINPMVTTGMNADFDGDQCLNQILACIPDKDVYRWSMSYHNLTSHEVRFASSTKIPAMQDGRYFLFDLEDFPHGDLVRTKEGTNGRIDFHDVPHPIYVISHDHATGELAWRRVQNWSKHYDREIEIVDTHNEYQLITDDDPRAVYGTVAGALDMQRFTPSQALEQHVLLPRARMLPKFEPTTWFIPGCNVGNSRAFKMKEHIQLTPTVGWIMGVMCGDGWVSGKSIDGVKVPRTLNLADNDGYTSTHWLSVISSVLENPFQGKFWSRGSEKVALEDGRYGDTSVYRVNSRNLAQWLSDLLGGERDETTSGSGNKHLPVFYLGAPEVFRKGLFAGLMDTDGSISVSGAKKSPQLMASYSTTSIRLALEVSLLARSLGIAARITPSQTPLGKACWMVTFSGPNIQTWGGEFMRHEGKLQKLNLVPPIVDSPVMAKYDIVPISRELAGAVSKAVGCPKLTAALRKNAQPEKVAAIKETQALYMAFKQSGSETHAKFGAISRIQAFKAIERLGRELIQTFPGGKLWLDYVDQENVTWERVVGVQKTGIRETGYDLTVPGYETFMSVDGVILSNTLNVHLPILPEAQDDVRNKLMPSKMLWSIRDDEKVVNQPKQELILGLYSAQVRDPKEKHTFPDIESALQAIRKGRVKLSDEINITG